MIWRRYGRVTVLAVLGFCSDAGSGRAHADGKIDVKRPEMLEFVKKKDQAKKVYHQKQS